MSQVTQILSAIQHGDAAAADQLLPLVYQQLRELAAAKLAHERPGQTLQATALVHEAYVRLIGHEADQKWDSKGHFFAAAAEAMRRILVERARRKKTLKHGGGLGKCTVEENEIAAPTPGVDILALNEALDHLAEVDHTAGELVKLRYFAGLTSKQAAESLGISSRTADRTWVYARSFLLRELEGP